MSEKENAPHDKNEREPDEEQNNILRELKVVRLVLEIVSLVARLISML